MDGLLDEDAAQYDEAVIWTVSKKGGSLDRAAVAIIQDDGLELGDGGFDPSTQASFSMLKFWARKEVSCKHNSLNLPSILLMENLRIERSCSRSLLLSYIPRCFCRAMAGCPWCHNNGQMCCPTPHRLLVDRKWIHSV